VALELKMGGDISDIVSDVEPVIVGEGMDAGGDMCDSSGEKI